MVTAYLTCKRVNTKKPRFNSQGGNFMSNPFEVVKHNLIPVEGKKIVYRGYCRSNDNSVNLVRQRYII